MAKEERLRIRDFIARFCFSDGQRWPFKWHTLRIRTGPPHLRALHRKSHGVSVGHLVVRAGPRWAAIPQSLSQRQTAWRTRTRDHPSTYTNPLLLCSLSFFPKFEPIQTLLHVRHIWMAPQDGMRLPTHWIPESYDVRLIPFLEPGRFAFDGFVRMNLVSVANSAQIVFHAKDMKIYEDKASVVTDEGRQLSIKGKHTFL